MFHQIKWSSAFTFACALTLVLAPTLVYGNGRTVLQSVLQLSDYADVLDKAVSAWRWVSIDPQASTKADAVLSRFDDFLARYKLEIEHVSSSSPLSPNEAINLLSTPVVAFRMRELSALDAFIKTEQDWTLAKKATEVRGLLNNWQASNARFVALVKQKLPADRRARAEQMFSPVSTKISDAQKVYAA